MEKVRDTEELSGDDWNCLFLDYNIRCERLVSLCLYSAGKYDASMESSAYLVSHFTPFYQFCVTQTDALVAEESRRIHVSKRISI